MPTATMVLCVLLWVSSAFGQSLDQIPYPLPTPIMESNYPVPVAENAERTGPGNVTVLSFPKYYRTFAGELAEVNTSFQPATDPQWQYQVTQGHWELYLSTAGTFQAVHQGDRFTFRLLDIGIGRGAAFRSLNGAKPNFSNYQVLKNTIRWIEVFPGIDLRVRYLHEALKTDVIVKQAFQEQLPAWEGAADPYLTVRFDVPELAVQAELQKDGEILERAGQEIEVGRPLVFVQDGKVKHTIPPALSYVADDSGIPLFQPEAFGIRSAQRWRFSPNDTGMTEVSAQIEDILNAPVGDIVIDPTLSFFAAAMDTTLVYQSYYIAGGNPWLMWTADDHMLFSWWNGYDWGQPIVPAGSTIDQATLEFYITDNQAQDRGARAYCVTENWDEAANWYTRLYPSTPWTYPGAFNVGSPPVSGPIRMFPQQGNFWMQLDVTEPMRFYFVNDATMDTLHKGFLGRMTNTKAIVSCG